MNCILSCVKRLVTENRSAALPCLNAVLVFGALFVGQAHAALAINSVTLNGAASTSVAPGATISVVVSETNTAGSNWRSVRIRTTNTSTGTQVTTCINTPDHDGNGDYSETFNITAPAAAGTYDVAVRASSNNTCGGTTSSTVTLAGGIIIVINAPTVTTAAASTLTATGATLNGTVSSNGASTTVTFDYGLTTAYGSSVAATPSPLAAGASGTAVSATVTGLTCGGTTYHYRVKGVNSAGTTNGGDQTFTTGACAVTLGKTVSTPAAITGSSVTFTILATNFTPIALSNVVVSDDIPASMTYSSNSPTLGTATVAGQLLTWTIPFLPPGASAQLSLTVVLTQRGTFTNTATSPGAADASVSILVLSSAFTHYRLEDPLGWNGTAGEVADSGVNHLNGRRRTTAASTTNTVVPNPTIASQQPTVVNGFCNAGSFDGNGVVETANSTFFHFGQTLSASAWIYPTEYPTGDLYSILSNDTNYEFHLDTGRHLYWWWRYATLTSAATIPLNRWTHIAITMDSSLGASSRQRIYINGVLDANTNNWSGTLDTNPCPFYIGGDIGTTSPQTNPPTCTLSSGRNFRGMIDEAKIYDFELTPAEVLADMNLGRLCGASTFDHIRIEHDGTASVCAPETVTVKACMDTNCNTQYPGIVTVHLSPAGWTAPSDTITIIGGVAQATLNKSGIVTPGITLGTATNGVSPIPANPTRCFNGNTETCYLSVAATTCGFDAVEVGANPATNLYTKLAGIPFNVDVLALNTSGTVNTAYTGSVTVDLVDASTTACSSSSTVLSTTQPYITYIAANNGRRTVNLTCPTAAQGAQVRIRYGASSVACSTDKLAVRPHAFALATSATNTGTTFKAGADTFTLNTTAATYNQTATGMPQTLTALASYTGIPRIGAIDTSPMGAGTWASGSLSLGTSLAAAVAGVSTNTPTYSEVGLFGLAGVWPSTAGYTATASDNTSARGVYDDTWTNIDKNQNDCVVNSYSNRLVGGMYGCNFGIVANQTFGRFYPDHFDTVISAVSGVPMTCPTNLTPTCPTSFNGFVYSGQAFTNLVTAKNLAGGTTQNYAGAYAHDVTLAAENAVGSTTAPSGAGTLNVTSAAATAFAAGTFTSSSQKYTFTTTPTAPTDVYVSANETAGGDGVSSRLAVPANSAEGGVKVVSGRIKASNEYGSYLLPLTAKVMAQYYTSTGWVYSSTDSVTKLAPTYSGLATTKTLNPASGILNFGNLSINLAAPGAAGTVTVTPSIDPTSPGYPPLGIIPGTENFGVYKSNNNFIYRRESY